MRIDVEGDMTSFLDGKVTLHQGDCLEVLREFEPDSIDSCVTDPPYHLTSIVKRFGSENAAPCKVGKTGAYARASAGFMGKKWDGGDIAFQPLVWELVFRALKPGAHLLAMGGTRTYHRMACAIEDAGFEIRDCVFWAYGSGFPKSHDVSKGIDRAAGAERNPTGRVKPGHEGFANRGNMSSVQSFKGTMGGEGGFSRPWMDDPEKVEAYHQKTAPSTEAAQQWEGWGTALKPAIEPIILARKPLSEKTVAANVLRWGTGAINIDGCRVPGEPISTIQGGKKISGGNYANREGIGEDRRVKFENTSGRWPANLIHDGSEEVLAGFPETGPAQASVRGDGNPIPMDWGNSRKDAHSIRGHFDSGGSAARFFYTAKADKDDRLGSRHPTVKPLDLIQYLTRLVTPKGGLVLDPFAGTGTLGEAAWREGFRAVLIEREAEYCADIERRMLLALAGPDERAQAGIKQDDIDDTPLFGGKE